MGGQVMDGYTGYIPFALAECNKCSALLLDHALAKANHTEWHRKLDVLRQNSIREQKERHQ